MLTDTHIRNAEYHEMTAVFDSLYERSKQNDTFEKLTDLIVSEDNIILAYRNMKTNKGSRHQE